MRVNVRAGHNSESSPTLLNRDEKWCEQASLNKPRRSQAISFFSKWLIV